MAVNEQHFAKDFSTVVKQDSMSFTSDYGRIDVSYNKEENTEDVTQTIKNGENTLLSSSYVYDEEKDSFEKSYTNDVLDNVSFCVQYDNEGNIISDERNEYTYGEYGQLVGVTGDSNASYSYDKRGNILTKTDNGETISFTYADSEWKDQLTKVNDTELTYDANGNMTSYGDTQLTWDYGKSLSSIKNDELYCYYKYDETGIRTAKTVNGETTKFNTLGGVVLAQKNSAGIMYFQYDHAGAPIGFVYNDVQYLYITNISGDVIGITDAQGNPIAEYTYDAWGKLLSITTAEENNEEQLALATANPLRYRGYYYDNETGYYYLQSRYYNPEWGRFISADSFAYLDTENNFSLNAYIYCWDCPVIFEDAQGTTPKISIDISEIQAFAVKLQALISNGKDKLTDFGNRILTSIQDTVDRFKQLNEKIKCKFTALGEKIKFKIHNFNITLNETFKKITGKDLNIFKIVEFIIERVHNNENDEQGSSVRRAKSQASEKNNVTMAVVQGLFGGIVMKEIYIEFEAINIDLTDVMNDAIKNNWYGLFQELMYTSISIFSSSVIEVRGYKDNKQYFTDGTSELFQKLIDANEEAGDFEEASKGSAFLKIFSLLGSVISLVNNIDNAGTGVLSKNADIVVAISSFAIDVLSSFIKIPFVDIIVSAAGSIISKVVAMRLEGLVLC